MLGGKRHNLELMLSSLPKILLHVHTETTRRLNRRLGITVASQYSNLVNNPSANEFYQSYKETPKNHGQFYSKSCISSLVLELLLEEVPNNVLYTEFRYNPMRWLEAGLSLEEIFSAVRCGMVKAQRCTNMLSGSIICFRRGTSLNLVNSVIEEIARLKPPELVGIDLAGDELTYPHLDSLQDSFRYLKTLGLGICVHAGEFSGPENIWEAIVYLGADRIGHGLSATKDPILIEYLIKHNIMLEISLSSNLWLKAVHILEEHPIRFLNEQGVLLSINTDIPVLIQTNMTRELEIANQEFGFSFNDLKSIIKNSNKKSFASQSTKRILEERLA